MKPASSSEEPVTKSVKATKSDDAEIPQFLWDDRVRRGLKQTLNDDKFSVFVQAFRVWLHRYWAQKVTQEFWTWWRWEHSQCAFNGKEFTPRNLEAGLCDIRHAHASTWWDWDQGSSPFFWRFPVLWMKEMCDGISPMWINPPPRYTQHQNLNPDPNKAGLEKKKLSKVRQRGYITPERDIRSLTSFFSVPKGPDDI
ncbi:hypothetical protein ACA910_021534 [Epithemia clementina (nom. ined.)]